MKKTPMLPDSLGRYLIPLNEAAKSLSISRETLYRLIREGEFQPPLKLRNRSYFNIADIQEYLDKLNRSRK